LGFFWSLELGAWSFPFVTFWTLIHRSLRFHARSHLGVVLGAAVGSAALIGALVVGDSVRGTLRERALQRLGWVEAALAPPDAFFTQGLETNLANGISHLSVGVATRAYQPGPKVVAALRLPGLAALEDGSARASQVQVLGVTERFWSAEVGAAFSQFPAGTILLNQALATQLNALPGATLILRVHKPSALSRDVPISPQSDNSVALRLKVHAIIPDSALGNFSLRASQIPPQNAFVHLEELARAAGLENRANLLLVAGTKETLVPSRPLWWHRMERHLPEALRSRARAADVSPEKLASAANASLRGRAPEDYQLELRIVPGVNADSPESPLQRAVEITSSRIFLPPSVARMSKPQEVDSTPQPLLTYLVNLIWSGERAVPYSMVTAAGPPYTPADLREDEIVINQWLAEELRVGPGDLLYFSYYLPESAGRLVEQTNPFRVRAVVPLAGIYADRTLMPEFPGLAKAESTHDWDAGFPLVHKIREQDETYWKEHRGTPKAFISLAAGQKLWANRFGNLTAIRYPLPPKESLQKLRFFVREQLDWHLDPAELGLRFEPVRVQALKAANEAQDFGQLFLGFSFFLIVAALLLMALLFQFGLEQRVSEVGTLLALGFRPGQVRRLFLWEGAVLAVLGGALGLLGGLGYAWAMLRGLATIWRDAVAASTLIFHASGMRLCLGGIASVLTSAFAIWLTLRRQARQSARDLLAGETSESGVGAVGAQGSRSPRAKVSRALKSAATVAAMAMTGALVLLGWVVLREDTANAAAFFGAGSLLLVAGLGFTREALNRLARLERRRRFTLGLLGFRGCTRRRNRSLAVVGLLACGSFIIVAIGAFRLEGDRDATKRSSGTGGFALLGESTLPLVRDLNTQEGREFYGLDEQALAGVSFVPLRVREGDDASCLNLNRAQRPRLLGVNPELLTQRGAFAFAHIAKKTGAATNDWMRLKPAASTLLTLHSAPLTSNEVPAIGDAASIQWALGKKVGDTLDYTDERGRPFSVRLVGAVANSILQGNLLIDESEFVQRFPSETGYRMFLIDAPSKSVSQVSAALSRALRDVGLELTPAARRLAAFNAVQNTYLSTFQVLGGLGLLLGSAGLGVVVLRNVLERRGELALLQAVGFRLRALHWLVLSEHGGLLGLGLIVGLVAALIAIWPALQSPAAELPYRSLLVTLAGVLASGLIWTWLATWLALRGRLLEALRNE
jgi:ABC-type antimicrobial peptide transport system permease subunit